MWTPDTLGARLAHLDRRVYALLVGAVLGAGAGLVGLGLAVAGPIVTGGALVGVLGALYVLTDLRAALFGVVTVLLLLPFGTLPFRVVLTPTLLDVALGAFVLVYLFQWMTGRRTLFVGTPVHALILLYAGWLVLAFVLGLRWGAPTPNRLRQFAETLLAIGNVFILVDMLREPRTLRRLALLVIVLVGTQAALAITLAALPDPLTERLLVRLARIGYPDGGVVRYVEDNPALAERAIGTWVDPNVLGGALAIFATFIAPQALAARPVLRARWLTWGVLGVVALALFLTYSRAAMLGFGAGLGVIALMRYRKLLPLMVASALAVLLLPQTQFYVERFLDAFQGEDLATQMRIGEYTDALRLIRDYPVAGVGFTGTPRSDLYTDVASMYLIMANQIGLVGVTLFFTMIAGTLLYGLRAWRVARGNPDLEALLLGSYAALATMLTTSVADMYFFRLDFQASITLFWLVMALALASARLALAAVPAQLTIAQPRNLR